MRCGSEGGVDELDAHERQELVDAPEVQLGGRAARQGDRVHKLKPRRRKSVAERKADAEAGAQVPPRCRSNRTRSRRRRPSSTKARQQLEQLQAKVNGEIADARAPGRAGTPRRVKPPRRPSSTGSPRPRRSQHRDHGREQRAAAAAAAVAAVRRAASAPSLERRRGRRCMAYAYAQLGQALLLRGRRPRLLRLLGPHDDGVGPGRRVDAARLLRPDRRCSRGCSMSALQPGDLVFWTATSASTSAAARCSMRPAPATSSGRTSPASGPASSAPSAPAESRDPAPPPASKGAVQRCRS